MNHQDIYTKRTLTEKESAIYIGMSTSFLRHARVDGNLESRTPAPKFIKIGRSIRYLREELDKWLDRFPRQNHLYENSKKHGKGK